MKNKVKNRVQEVELMGVTAGTAHTQDVEMLANSTEKKKKMEKKKLSLPVGASTRQANNIQKFACKSVCTS